MKQGLLAYGVWPYSRRPLRRQAASRLKPAHLPSEIYVTSAVPKDCRAGVCPRLHDWQSSRSKIVLCSLVRATGQPPLALRPAHVTHRGAQRALNRTPPSASAGFAIRLVVLLFATAPVMAAPTFHGQLNKNPCHNERIRRAARPLRRVLERGGIT